MKTAIAAALLLSGLVVAQTVTDQYKQTVQPQDFRADVVAEQRVYVVKGLKVDGGCVGCTTGVGTCSFDFPVLDPVAPLGQPCGESFECAFSGSAIGLGCSPSSNLGADGGAALSSTATLSCRATAAGAVGQLCFHATDGGTYNLHDAGFTYRVFQ